MIIHNHFISSRAGVFNDHQENTKNEAFEWHGRGRVGTGGPVLSERRHTRHTGLPEKTSGTDGEPCFEEPCRSLLLDDGHDCLWHRGEARGAHEEYMSIAPETHTVAS